MKRSPAPLAAFVVLLSLACGDDPSSTSPSHQPSAIILDGTRSNEADDFFFLPPLVADPSAHANFDDEGFNPALNPSVQICELAADPNLDPATDCRTTGTGPVLVANFGPASITVSEADEHYRANWRTDDSNLSPDRFYRIQVFLGSTRVGFADIDPVTSARELRSLRTGEVIPLVDGRTLPIRFRLENGVLCENESDCGEFRVTNDGGTFLTNTGFAGVRFEPGFLPPGVEEATLTIERVVVPGDNRCHGESSGRLWREFEGCYSFTLDPDVAPFGGIQRPALVGKCSELPATDPLYDLQQGYKSRDGEGLEALPNVPLPADFGLDCENFAGSIASARISNPLLRLAHAGWRGLGAGVARVMGVKSAYAIDLGLGDRVRVGSSFSNINWGIGLEAAPISAVELELGYGLTSELSIRTTHGHLHEHVPIEGPPVPETHTVNVGGVMVRYEVTAGNGNFGFEVDGVTPVRIREVFTSFDDAENETSGGRAVVSFTADDNADDNVVTASAPTLLGQPVTFSITGLRPDLIVENLVRSVENPGPAEEIDWTFDVRNVGAGRARPSVASIFVLRFISANQAQQVATASVPVPALEPGGAVSLATSLTLSLEPGVYRMGVIADGGTFSVREVDEANNASLDDVTVSDGEFGSISGTVVSLPTGAGVGGARVRVLGTELETTTNGGGQYFLTRVPVGQHEVIAIVPDHIAAAATVDVVPGSATASFTMSPTLHRELAVGNFHGCAIGSSGGTWCWGNDDFGQLGQGTITSAPSTPVLVTGGHTFTAIRSAGSHTCGITSDGTGWCWGRNTAGITGDGTTVPGLKPTPVMVLGGPWRTLAGGRLTTCGLMTSGAAWCWGLNQHGELGIADVPAGTGVWTTVPAAVTTSLTFESITAGWLHTCALTPPGEAHCWGAAVLNGSGTGERATTPVPVATQVAFHRLYAGSNHTCGVTRGGDAYCWGNNAAGQLGDGSTTVRPTPVLVSEELSFVALAPATTPNSNSVHTCGITATGEAYCWGTNALGQLGNGTTASSSVPLRVASEEVFVAIGTGDGQSCAMTRDRRVFCWGINQSGELGSGTEGGFSTIPMFVGRLP